MPMPTTTWSEEAARARCRKSVEVCERFFVERYGGKRPETANGQVFYDLCLAEYEVRKHLLSVDCFSSREALVAELRRLLTEPVVPSSSPPCRADQYLDCQRKDIEAEIHNLMLDQKRHEKPWFQRLFGRGET